MPAVSLKISNLHPDDVSESIKLAMGKGIRSFDSTGNSDNEKMTGVVIQEMVKQQLIQSRHEFFYAINIYAPNLQQEEITTKLQQSLFNLKILYANLVIVHTATTDYSVADILAILRGHVDHRSISVGVVLWDNNESAQSAAEGIVTTERNGITVQALMPYEAEEDCLDFQESGEAVEKNTREDSFISVLHNENLEIYKPVGGVVNFHSQSLKREVYKHHFEEFRVDSCRMSRMEFTQFDFSHIGLPGYFLKDNGSCPGTSAEDIEAQQSVEPVHNAAQKSIGSVDVEAQGALEQVDNAIQQLFERVVIDGGNKIMKKVLGNLILFIIIYVALSILPNYI